MKLSHLKNNLMNNLKQLRKKLKTKLLKILLMKNQINLMRQIILPQIRLKSLNLFKKT